MNSRIPEAVDKVVQLITAKMQSVVMGARSCLDLIKQAREHMSKANDLKSFEHYALLQDTLDATEAFIKLDKIADIETVERHVNEIFVYNSNLMTRLTQALTRRLTSKLSDDSNEIWGLGTSDYSVAFGRVLTESIREVSEQNDSPDFYSIQMHLTPNISITFRGRRIREFSFDQYNREIKNNWVADFHYLLGIGDSAPRGNSIFANNATPVNTNPANNDAISQSRPSTLNSSSSGN